MGGEKRSVRKVFDPQARGPELDPQNPHKNRHGATQPIIAGLKDWGQENP